MQIVLPMFSSPVAQIIVALFMAIALYRSIARFLDTAPFL
jgi:hypothetical protein